MDLKSTTLHFEREGFYADVENVSAYICPRCGTRGIPGPTATKIGKTRVSKAYLSMGQG